MSALVRWSRYPKETYTITLDGRVGGLGLNPLFDNPGVWNLTWLVASDFIESLIGWSKPPEEFPFFLECLPAVVGTSLQLLPGLVTLGAVADQGSPTHFLNEIKRHEVTTLLEYQYGPMWLEWARKGAKAYRPRKSNILTLRQANKFPKSH